jgi:hypothetical protein
MRRAAVLLAGVATLLLGAAPASAQEPVEVRVGILVINFGSYDANRGTYILDFYLWFRWDAASAPEDFVPTSFEFMNGRPASRERILDETDPATGWREVWFRVQANLYSEPRFRNYPYDRQALEVLFEDSVHPVAELVYVPLMDVSGLDESVRVSGWRIRGWTFEATEKTYSFNETYSRGRFAVHVEKPPGPTTIKTFLPPLAFAFVSGLSFLLHPSKSAQRIAFGTSMLISAVLYHISQTINLPIVGGLIFFDKVLISLYVFLAGSLAVTTLIVMNEDYWKKADWSPRINRQGAAATLGLTVGTFLLLLLF